MLQQIPVICVRVIKLVDYFSISFFYIDTDTHEVLFCPCSHYYAFRAVEQGGHWLTYRKIWSNSTFPFSTLQSVMVVVVGRGRWFQQSWHH
jgi:hypothetical protein